MVAWNDETYSEIWNHMNNCCSLLTNLWRSSGSDLFGKYEPKSTLCVERVPNQSQNYWVWYFSMMSLPSCNFSTKGAVWTLILSQASLTHRNFSNVVYKRRRHSSIIFDLLHTAFCDPENWLAFFIIILPVGGRLRFTGRNTRCTNGISRNAASHGSEIRILWQFQDSDSVRASFVVTLKIM